MRALLLTDTHGDLHYINELAAATFADLVVHAGDFGLYDQGSDERLSDRELALRIVHSGAPEPGRSRAFQMNRKDKLAFIRQHQVLGDFPAYLRGERRFAVPVYAVWGNHDDCEVVKALRAGQHRVENLILLDETGVHLAAGLRLFGLGGNVLHGPALFDAPVAGTSGTTWATLSQFVRLWQAVREQPAPGPGLFVSHVSPGKDPLVRHLAAHMEADLLISGHMGSPYACTWSEFAVRPIEEAQAAAARAAEAVRAIWESGEKDRQRDPEEVRLIELGLDLLSTPPPKVRTDRRGQSEPAWYRAFAINLPDAKDGYALLEERDGALALTTVSAGLRLPLP